MERNKVREEGKRGRMLEEEEEKGGGDELGWVCVTRGAVSLSPPSSCSSTGNTDTNA